MSWGVRLTYRDGTNKTILLGSHFQAEYFIHLIPFFMVSGSRLVENVASAKIVGVRWTEGGTS